MRVCYALTSAGDDLYSQQTFISASLVRWLYPEATITVVVDEFTEPALRACDDRVLGIADDLTLVATGMENPTRRNRVLKTTLREKVNGDLLYLDADTIPIRRFNEVFDHDAPLAAVPDYTEQLFGLRRPRWVRDLYRHLRWHYPPRHYFNGGVLFMADRPETHRFAEEWHQRWRRCVTEANCMLDQPSLNSASDATGIRVKVLPHAFNCAVRSTAFPVRRARIFHYFSSQADKGCFTLLDHLVRHVRERGDLDWHAVERAAATGDPYVADPPGLKCRVTSGRYRRAALLCMARLLGRARAGR
ncbi:MAG TPA: hypothetical protein P5532_10955 [Planctomycetota bacterium]|nr:hypothetical protein [Planctomycetota bacterium]HRT94931.1 hypothetical protein [Planctomycetota bacterium]